MSTPEYDNPTARVVRAEVEVPGTPDQVWQAIATGPGITAWATPAEVEEREGGRMVSQLGDGTVTAWDPPRRFAYELPGGLPGTDPGAPPWANEFLVEARGGGTCVVRLVSGFFRDGEGWEDQLEGTDRGWRNGLTNLRLYLTHFGGRPGVELVAMTNIPGEEAEVSSALAGALGLSGLGPGDAFRAPADAPPLEGIVEQANADGRLLRTTVPGPGLFEVSTHSGDGTTMVAVFGFLYGDDRAELLEREQPRWSDWLQERFPAVAAPA